MVCKALGRGRREVVAIKKVEGLFEEVLEERCFTFMDVLREIYILSELEHDNIIALKRFFRPPNENNLYLIYQYAETDLSEAIRSGVLEDTHKSYILYQLLTALKFLHSAGVVHNNIKPNNILINSDSTIKLADFTYARLTGEPRTIEGFSTAERLRGYVPPEVLLGSLFYTREMDIWSLGCLFGEILLGEKVFPGISNWNQLERILEVTGIPSQEDLLSLGSEFAETMVEHMYEPHRRSLKKELSRSPPKAVKLLKRFLVFNPSKRISIDEALVHPYVSQFFDPKDLKTRSPLKIPFDTTKKSLEYGCETFTTLQNSILHSKIFVDWPNTHHSLPLSKQGLVELFLLILERTYHVPKDLSILLIRKTLTLLKF
uniref:Protein kinase domain-containing protein n=1 Tax=Arcella intermedia TaxID=1963864 RepID=A0A6B2L743_9EUKA